MLLGQRVNHAEFNDEDIDLLQTLIATVTPLIANSFLYSEKAHLSARYRLILDSVRQAIFVFNAQGFLRLANQTAIDLICTLVDSDFGGGPAGLPMDSVFPDAVFPGWVERLQRARQDNETKLLSTMVATPRDGERIFNVRIGALADLGTHNEETVITLMDVTDQKDNERRMFELEKFAEQGVMASSISHELNNHLGVLLGGIELVTFNLARGNTDKVNQTLAKLREGVERMGRFTSGLMDFARVNAVRQPSQINDVITDVLSFVMAQKRFSRINVKTLLTPQMPMIDMNRDQIAQLVINLLNNAADAIAETGRTDGIIIVSTTAGDNALTLSISDNGRGMPPEVRDKLFKTHLTTKPKGHGYGLMTCARILEMHNASVAINSRTGFGTTFEFTFKLADTPASD
jgi:signal transduction histidine kinase